MRTLALLLIPALLAGCVGTHPRGTSNVDEFDAIQVDQMVGNNVSYSPLQKVVLCLNARRETRQVAAITNVVVGAVTNSSVLAVTNEIVSISTNFLYSTMTNLSPALAGQAGGPVSDEAAAVAAATVPADSAAVVTLTNAGPSITTNTTASVARNSTATTAPGQKAGNVQVVKTFNNQITTASNNLSISMMTNLVVTAETNFTVSYVTNYVISAITNTTITPTNMAVHEYFVYTELIPPADFNLQPGESLVLLVDGERHGLTAAQSGTTFIPRRGFTATIYKVEPETLVAIANAREVRVRVKGTTSLIERTMSDGSRRNFKTFLVRYFSPESPDQPPGPAGSSATVRGAADGNESNLANLR